MHYFYLFLNCEHFWYYSKVNQTQTKRFDKNTFPDTVFTTQNVFLHEKFPVETWQDPMCRTLPSWTALVTELFNHRHFKSPNFLIAKCSQNMMLLRKQFIVRREWEKLRWGAFIKGKESICSAWYIRLKKDSVICTTWLTKTFLSLQTFYYQKSIFVCCVLMRTGFHKLLFLSNYFLYHVGAFRGKIQDLDWFRSWTKT